MNNETKKTARNYFHFDFDLVKKHLKKLSNNKDRKNYLVGARTEYKQTYLPIDYSRNDLFDFEKVPDFGMKCDFEINKLKEEIQEESQNNSKDGDKYHKDLTIDRAILLLKLLAPQIKSCNNNKVAEVIAFLIGRDTEAVRQNLSKVNNKFVNHPQAFNEDVRIVCKYLNLLGLTNEAKKLKEDSGVA